jgi:hypothetical protein
MVTITCQESGIEFEAATSRTKQHPKIAVLKAWANKASKYRELNTALAAVRKAGGYETIEQFVSAVEAHMDAAKAKAQELSVIRARDAREAEEAAKATRQRTNDTLKAHGYKWTKVFVYEDDAYEWVVEAPDGRLLPDEGSALYEIERGGIEAVRAEQAAQEAAEQAKRAAVEAEADAAIEAIDAAHIEISHTCIEVERFDATGFEITHRVPHRGYRALDTIRRGTINNVPCYLVIVDTMADFDGHYHYYSADPVASGHTPKPPRS